MKLQYKCYEHIGFQYMIQLYYDGWLCKSYKVYSIDLDDEIDKLEKRGFTCGFTEEEVNKVKKRYEWMLDNIIVKKEDIPEEIIDKLNNIGCTSFMLKPEEIERLLNEKY